jgi:hypothetical protein
MNPAVMSSCQKSMHNLAIRVTVVDMGMSARAQGIGIPGVYSG